MGNGIVADISKYMTRILEINEKEHWVRVEPVVVLDERNKILKQFPDLSLARRNTGYTLEMNPMSVELIDKTILELTRKNIEQNKNRFFVEGDSGAVLVVEFAEDTAVNPQVLPEYVEEFTAILKKYNKECVYLIFFNPNLQRFNYKMFSG